MFKKILYSMMIIFIISSNTYIIYADDENETITQAEYIEAVNQTSEEPNINSRIAIVFDRKSGSILYGKNENKKTAMASTTKIMTAIIVLGKGNLSETITVSEKAAGTGGSRLGLKANDKITMNDLLYGLMLKSGNDSAIAIAEAVGGSVEEFAQLMNNKAQELGLESTHFVTPHGLDNPEHYTTAYELAKLADYALKNEKFAQIVNTKNYTVTINGYPKNISNTNELLGYLQGVNGVKTGFTNNAGRCLVTSVNRNNFEIIAVVLQADTKKFRTTDSIKIIEYAYKNYEYVNIKEIVDNKFKEWCLINKSRIQINKKKEDNLELYISELENDIIPIKKIDIDKIDIDISSIYYIDAPVEKDFVIGTLKVIVDENVVDVIEIKVRETVEKRDIWDYFLVFAKEFMYL